jgi:hypothetical protein
LSDICSQVVLCGTGLAAPSAKFPFRQPRRAFGLPSVPAIEMHRHAIEIIIGRERQAAAKHEIRYATF